MRYSISIVVLNNLELTRKCLELVEAKSGDDYELIISDNASTDGTAAFLRDFSSRHPSCRIITYPFNTGFGHPHNQALRTARGEYFVVLNNDIFIYENGWLGKLEKAFSRNARLAITGFADTHSGLDDDGAGIKSSSLEYVEASCLMVPCALAKEYGLFSAEYELAYREDADLSLRYRQMGFDICLVKCAHDHVNSATAFNIDQGMLSRVKLLNRKTFLNRWSGYVQQRTFTSRVLVRAESGPLQLLKATTVLKKLKDQQPLVQFDLETNHPELFSGNPAVSGCFMPGDIAGNCSYDRVINFDFAAVHPDRPLALSLAEQASVHIDSFHPVLTVTAAERERSEALLPVGSKCVLVDGRVIAGATFDVVRLLKEKGFSVAVVGEVDSQSLFEVRSEGVMQRLDLRGMAGVVSCCGYVIGQAGLLTQIASSQDVPALVVLKPGQSPWIEGVDLSTGFFMEDDFDAQQFALKFEGMVAGDQSGNIAWLQAVLLKKAYRYDNDMHYFNVDIDSRIGEYQEMANYYSRQLNVARDAALIYTSLSWRITAPLRKLHQLLTNRK